MTRPVRVVDLSGARRPDEPAARRPDEPAARRPHEPAARRPDEPGGPRTDPEVAELLVALAAALDGSGPAVLVSSGPVPAEETAGDAFVRAVAAGVPDGVALVVRTSGSTGAPRAVLLGAAALRASADATAARLGGHGRWLLALPADHVAGLQVLVRSVLAGTTPVALAPGSFGIAGFAAAVDELVGADEHERSTASGPGGPPAGPTVDGGARRYTSLVPTQLRRLLGDPVGERALRAFDAVLLGGAAAEPTLVAGARTAGIRVVTTYGMSETCGGCVYDGVPLDGVHVALEPDGRILLAGPMLASGYLGRAELDTTTFVERGGTRWLRTSDVGSLAVDASGTETLTVLGRLDDVIVTGGHNVAPLAVERAVAGIAGIAEVCVVGVPDPEWGHAVTAVVVLDPGASAPALTAVRSAVTRAVGRASAPRDLVVVDALPLRGPGKTDRAAVAAIATDARRTSRPVG